VFQDIQSEASADYACKYQLLINDDIHFERILIYTNNYGSPQQAH
jgi:hypothetical protein